MKKYCFLMVLLLAGTFSFGQTLAEVNDMLGKSQYKKAKDAIDKFLSDAKNAAKGDGWYYKGRVYNAYSKDSSLPVTEATQLKLDAFEAFKKYQQLDVKQVSFVLENYASYFDLYNGFFDIGAKAYSSKNYASSFEGFKNALQVEDYVRSKNYEYNGFKFGALDTSLVQNTAMAANAAKDEASAAKYYRILTDANLAGENYLSIYAYLVEHYIKNNDEVNYNAMMEKGRKLYPENEYWTEIEIDRVSKKGDKEALYTKYEELANRYPTKYIYPYNLAVELFNDLYTAEKKPANTDAYRTRIFNSLKNAIPLDKGTDANMLMTRHLYNISYDYQDSVNKYKGMQPAQVKKRGEFKALSQKKIEEAIIYADASVAFFEKQSTLKPMQKINHKNMLDILAQLYTAKGDLKKAAEYEKKKAAVSTN